MQNEKPAKEATKQKPIHKANPTLRAQLEALRDLPEWSNSVIAKKLGCSTAYVSLYINDQFTGDIDSFERDLNDLFTNEARRRASGVETVDSDETEQMTTALECIRKTNDIGVVLAPSGGGKTRGEELYVKKNPLAILYRTCTWNSDRHSVESTMFELVGKPGYDGRTKRVMHTVTNMRGSDRLMIVDDAHKLTKPALQWWIDFHDATLCPLALVGTFALEDKIQDDPQRFSRAGLRWEIRQLDTKGRLVIDRDLIKHLVKQLCPSANGETHDLCDLCEQVAREHGHYRSVHKQLKLAAELKSGRGTKWVEAFRDAHTMLFREFQLV